MWQIKCLHEDLLAPKIKNRKVKFVKKYLHKLENHPTNFDFDLLDKDLSINGLKRALTLYLKTKFNKLYFTIIVSSGF